MQVSDTINLVKAFNWQNPSWDLFILGAWIVAAIVYAFATGRGRVLNILLSIYIAKLMVIEAPFLTNIITKSVPNSLQALQQLAAFVAIFLVLFMLLGRFVFKTSSDSKHLGAALFSLIFSFLQIGLLINIILNFLPPGAQANFGPLVQTVFIKSPASFVWLVAPIVYLVFLGKFVGDNNEI